MALNWNNFTVYNRSWLKIKLLVVKTCKYLLCHAHQPFMASYPTHQDVPRLYKDVKTWCPHAHDQQFIITPRTLLPWLLAGRVWEQDDKQWKPGNEATRLVGPTYFRCLLPAFLQPQYHVMSCDIIVNSCDDNVCSLQRGLSPQVLGVCLLEKFLCPLGPETREETWVQEPDNKHHRYHFFLHSSPIPLPPTLSPPLPQIILVCRFVWGIYGFRVCKLTLNMWWNSQNLTSREQGKQLTAQQG